MKYDTFTFPFISEIPSSIPLTLPLQKKTAASSTSKNVFYVKELVKFVLSCKSHLVLFTISTDTFASKVAAVGDEYADSSIGNVTGSNSVNVFLGLGVAWSIAAIAKAVKGEKFDVPAGNLGFSVVVFCVTAVIAIAVMMLRRNKAVGGELGGTKVYKLPTSLLLCFLWVVYIVLSSLQTYCHIKVSF